MHLRLPLLSLLLTTLGLCSQTPPEDLAKRVDSLSRELEQMKRDLAQAPASDTSIGGYGEIIFSHNTHSGAQDSADLRRFVLSVSHRFDARTELVSELEVEHAVSSASDKGEVEVEQAYLERQLNGTWALRAGLFLVPAGMLNEHHEPTTFYGVERNFVETAIIPSTWREGGLQVVGSFQNGLLLQAGLSTGFDLSKWDPNAAENRDSPLATVHQELSQARSHSLAGFAALNWRGVPGLLLGASLFTGKGGQGQPEVPAMTTTLWDAHLRWTPGRFEFSALYAQGSIQDSAAFNQTRLGNPYPVPSRFDGWYGQAAYALWSADDYALAPFVRFETFNTAAAFAPLSPASLTAEPAANEKVWTAGFNFNVNKHIVLKADLQRFQTDSGRNRVDLGLGWAF